LRPAPIRTTRTAADRTVMAPQAYRWGEEVASMDGSQPGKGIDPQMIRDHGADVEVLDKEIREIELEALQLQARLQVVRPMPTQHHRSWRRQHSG
jgi:hypothetical protein